MVTLNKEKQKKAHEKLHNAIFNCDCKPWRKLESYCDKCHAAVIKFMEDFGAGVLTRDMELYELSKGYAKLLRTNVSLEKRLDEKIKRVEELKEMVDSPTP